MVRGEPAGQAQARQVGQVQARPGGQRVGGRHRDQERLGHQRLVVQAAVIEGGEQQPGVGPSVAHRLRLVAAWDWASDYLQSQPGYVDRALHRSVAPDAESQFVNIARWRTAEDFRAATQSPGFREATAGLAVYQSHPALYRVVRA